MDEWLNVVNDFLDDDWTYFSVMYDGNNQGCGLGGDIYGGNYYDKETGFDDGDGIGEGDGRFVVGVYKGGGSSNDLRESIRISNNG
jgi:hypothetical protein